MKEPQIPQNESQRLDALKEYSILDTLPEDEYDNITYLASYICGTPISLVSLIDENRQWFKSRQGLGATETPRSVSFCGHAINEPGEIFVIPDSRKDERFFDNPLVTGNPHVIFYAGIPIVSQTGFALGTLCVIDDKPKNLSQKQIDALRALGNQLSIILEKRRQTAHLEILNQDMQNTIEGLENFARIAAHDIKSPLNSIVMLVDILENSYKNQLDNDGVELIDLVKSSSLKLANLIDGILQYSKDSASIDNSRETIDVKNLVIELKQLLDSKDETELIFENNEHNTVFSNRIAIEQILLNLISNSIKYNDKEKTIIKILIKEGPEFYSIIVSDNGPGITKEEQKTMFNIFETTSNTDKVGEKGTGIGLATVKSLMDKLGGKIEVFSETGKGLQIELILKK